jgi:ferritin-like metal-binding protein YciE
MKTLKNLFSEELADRHDSEKQLLNFIPRLLKAATSVDLQKLLQSHLKESSNHIKSIEKIFQNIGESPKTRKCEVTVGIIKECEHAIKEYHGSPVVNVAIIACVQKMEHCEIAQYGCLHAWAKTLENKEVADLLQAILAEEKAMDHALSELACNHSNDEARAGKAAPLVHA